MVTENTIKKKNTKTIQNWIRKHFKEYFYTKTIIS